MGMIELIDKRSVLDQPLSVASMIITERVAYSLKSIIIAPMFKFDKNLHSIVHDHQDIHRYRTQPHCNIDIQLTENNISALS
jgi:hypothetical protein